MARLGWLGIVSAVALVSVGVAPAGPRAGSARSVRVTIGPMRLVSPAFGYAVAYRAVQRGVTVKTAIGLFLYERGRWRNVTPPMLSKDGVNAIDDVAFVDRRHGWVAAYNCANVGVYLYRTSDGGRSWQSLGKPTSHSCGGGPTYLSFVDGRHGWMEPVSPNAPEVELLETSDGGESWKHVASGPPNQVRSPAVPCLAPVRFISLSTGWMGRCGLGDDVFSTADGGRRWKRARIAIPDGADARFDLPWFFGREGVVAATVGTRPSSETGRTRAVAFSVTQDGGGVWTPRSRRRIASCPLRPYVTNVWPASIASRRVWWIVAGAEPTTQVTSDAGRTWRTNNANGLPEGRCSVTNVSAGGPKTAWVVARDGKDSSTLFRTADAGRNWQRVALFQN